MEAVKAKPTFEERFASYGRRMIEQNLYMKNDARIRRKMGAIAIRHINASAEELRDRLLEVFNPSVKQMFSSDEIDAELKRLGY